MNTSANLFFLLSIQKTAKSYRNFHFVRVLNQNVPDDIRNPNFDTSLFFTNLPNKRRQKKVKRTVKLEPRGPLIIDCKNKELNLYGGKYYGKFDVIPMASKGWAHRKSKGDYFTIMPSEKYSPYATKEYLPSTFEENEISQGVIEQLKKIEVKYPTVVQAKTFEKLLAGENAFILGECGSGKTLAYIIAMVENILKWKDKVPKDITSPLGIIILPRRELVHQVLNLGTTICSDLGLKCGALMSSFIEGLVENSEVNNSDILICNIKALNKAMEYGLCFTKYTKHVVVDDVHLFESRDKLHLLQNFFKYSNLNFSGLNSPNITGNNAQVCFVSAIASSTIEENLSELIRGNEFARVKTPHVHKFHISVPQKFLRMGKMDLPAELLGRAKKADKKQIPTLIFSNRTKTSIWISMFLKENKVKCVCVNKEQSPVEQLENLRDFQLGNVNILSTTNILSNGIHLPKLRQVISYEFPLYLPDYIYRCGRVGRLNQVENCLITHFISRPSEVEAVQKIEKSVRLNSVLSNLDYPYTRLSNPKLEYESEFPEETQ